MANGLEDLREKNSCPGKNQNKKNISYTKWANFQGREDAEMLMEKSSFWSAQNSSRGDYDWED